MSKELNCMNCSIGDFKHELCDCDNGFCKEFKSIGTQEDFFNAVMQRIRPQGEWIEDGYYDSPFRVCSHCGYEHPNQQGIWKFCPSCGAKMGAMGNE